MKKVLFILFISLFTAISVVSCKTGDIEETNTPEPVQPTNIETPEPPEPLPDGAFEMDSGTIVYSWGCGSGTILYDIDGDGEEDEIDFGFNGYDASASIADDDINEARDELMQFYMDSCNITINGQSTVVRGENLQGLVIVADIDKTDGVLDILVPEDGPSDDYFTTFLRYDGGMIKKIGKTGGVPQGPLRIDGSGIIETTERGRILQTWFYDARYKVVDDELSEIRTDGYVMMGSIAYTIVELPLQTSPTDDSIIYTAGVNEMVLLTWTDNERWLCVEASGGIKGWIEIQDFSFIKAVGKYGNEVFQGLSYAD